MEYQAKLNEKYIHFKFDIAFQVLKVLLIKVNKIKDIDLRLFWFSRKIAHAHTSGRQNKNKLKEEHVESSEQA